MKGLVSSADFLRAVLNKEVGLRTGKTLSSVTVLKTEKMDRFVIMTDGGMNMYPTLEEKCISWKIQFQYVRLLN